MRFWILVIFVFVAGCSSISWSRVGFIVPGRYQESAHAVFLGKEKVTQEELIDSDFRKSSSVIAVYLNIYPTIVNKMYE